MMTYKRSRRLSPAILATVLCSTASVALAASDHPQNSQSEPTPLLETLVITGKAPSVDRIDLAGSVDIITRDQLEFEHVDDTLELFNKAPGVYLSRYNQGVINADLAIRGFAGDGSSPHGKLLIDGIPSNLHNGYAELDQLFPLAIDRIQLFKGTSDPRYGLYNVAGNYNVISRSDVSTAIQATIGSYDSRELLAYHGREDGKLSHSYSAGIRQSNGYRDHTDLEKYALSGRWFYQLNDATEAGIIARSSHYSGDAPGYLSKSEARQSPRFSASYADQDGGEKNVHHLSAHLNTELSNDVEWQSKLYWQNFDRERWVRFSNAGSLQDRYDDQQHIGAITTLNWQIDNNWRLNWGADIEQQDVLEQRFGTIGQTRQRDTSNVLRNREYQFNTLGSYLQIEHTPNDFIRWNLAYRVDKLSGDFKQTSAGGIVSKRKMYDFGLIKQPKFNLFISPSEQVTLFANIGRSYQHPFGASAYTSGNTNSRDVSINNGWETGLQWTPNHALELRASVWEQKAEDEYVVVNGNAQNVGETQRRGLDLGANWQVNSQLLLWANYSLIDTEIVATSSANAGFVGNQLRSIPKYTASLGIDLQLSPKLSTKVHIDSQGDYYVNEANTGGKFGGYTLVGANLNYDTDWGAVSLQANNLFDQYAEYVYDFGQTGTSTIHSPFDGRNISLTFTWLL